MQSKNLIIVAVFVLFGLFIHAQPIPPSISTSAPVSYTRIWNVQAPIQDQSIIPNQSVQRVLQTTQYVDGLGRNFQTNVKEGSKVSEFSNVDLVTTHYYDQYGREPFQILPFASSTNNGLFKYSHLSEQNSFYNNYLSGQGEQYFYSQTNFENSPQSRTLKQLAPGIQWIGSNRGVSNQYLVNETSEDVKLILVSGQLVLGQSVSYWVSSNYAAGSLKKNETVDEHQKKVVEYYNKEGKIILKKVQLADFPTASYSGWLSTYYVYDNNNQLRMVIQPRGVEELVANGWNITSTIINEQCFLYEYDAKQRMIQKKVPGAGAMEMVYDNKDRLILSRDARFTAQNKWNYTRYDALNRPIETGILTYPQSRASFQYIADLYSNPDFPYTWYSLDVLTNSYYDNYSWLPFSPISGGFNTLHSPFLYSPSSTSFPYAQAHTPSTVNTGRLTGERVRVLGTGTFLWKGFYYDQDGRLIQLQQTNLSGGVDIQSTQYSFNGKPLIDIQRTFWNGSQTYQFDLVKTYEYDNLWRITSVFNRVVGAVNGSWVDQSREVKKITYDALGNVKNTILAPYYNQGTGIENQQYDYNVRGWILGVNRNYLSTSSLANHRKFGFELSYDKVVSITNSNQPYTPQYNGNIGGMSWRSGGDGEFRRYDFSYDAANRLMRAIFSQFTGGSFNQNAGYNFDSFMGNGVNSTTAYDANGNILRMQQWGLKGTTSVKIDDIEYGYRDNGLSNKLRNVTETGGNGTTNHGLGDFTDKHTGWQDYDYDVDGNMVSDLNKDITNITYNFLNLPEHITVQGKGSISYVYDATGRKLRKSVTEGSTKTTDYVNNIVVENGQIQHGATDDGRFRSSIYTTGTIIFDYFLKDHLGNVRMVLTDEIFPQSYPTLNGDGASTALQLQDAVWENKDGQSISVANTRVARPGGFGSASSNGDWVFQITKQQGAIGAAKLLKVMSGDVIHSSVDYYYTDTYGDNSNSNGIGTLLGQLGTILLNGSIVEGALKGTAGSVVTNLGNNSNFINALWPQQSSVYSVQPKGYLHILLFNERFEFDAANSRIIAMDPWTAGVAQRLNLTGSVNKNGYAYIYFSNESNNMVYFDNFDITHVRGPILEETHYYPFGLTMKGISSRAANSLENRYKANGGTEYSSKEFTDGSGLDWYDTDFRRYNAQIGRFTGIDALSSFAPDQSPYSFVQNNPISFIDPQGLDTVRVNGEGSHKIKVRQGDILAWTIGETTSYYTYDPNNKDAVNGFVGGGLQNDEPLPEVTVTAKSKGDAGGSNLKDQITWGIDAGFSITETSRATFRLTNGTGNGSAFSPKWYSPSPVTGRGWGGGSRAGIKTFKVSSAAKAGSWGLFGVGVVFDGIGVYKYYTAPNTDPNVLIQPVHPAKASLNTAMGYFSLKFNPIAGALYFGVDAFYPGGWKGYANDYDRIQKANEAIVPGFITAPYGALKQ